MTALSTIVRATHLLTNAAWFGGTLAGAVAIDPASKEAGSGRERAQLLDEGWRRWGPVQGAAIGLHLVSGLGILADNRHRVLGHRPTTAAVVAKTVLTGVAVVMSAEAYRSRAELREVLERADTGEGSREKAQALTQRMGWVQWVTPATTAGLLVLDAYLGEQQRGVAGLLDEPMGLRHRR